MKFLKEHYEKVVLTIFLVVFVGALLWLLNVLKQEKQLKDAFTKILIQKANYKQTDFSKAKYNVLESLDSEIVWNSSEARNNTGFNEYSDLMIPFEIAFSPYVEKLIPKSSFGTDERSGICPFSGKVLQESKIKLVMDEDKDGIPDDVEIKNGLNPKDPSDAVKDLDEDGFTNLDEYQTYATEMNNPKSRPSYVNNINLLSVEKIELPIIFKMVSKAGEDKSEWMIQVVVEQWNEFNKEFENKEPWLTVGQKFKVRDIDYKVVDIKNEIKEVFNNELNVTLTEETFLLVIQQIGNEDLIDIQINEVVYDPKIKIELEDHFTKNKYQVVKNDIISVGNDNVGFDKFIIDKVITTTKGEQYVEIKDEDGEKVYKITKKITSVNN